jgi:hypothetical protein
MGINGTAHSWFTSYLQGRSQCVDIEGNFFLVFRFRYICYSRKYTGAATFPMLYK